MSISAYCQVLKQPLLLPALFRFDKRITNFAEEKFQRDGIDLKTGSMVIKLTADEISTKEKGTGKIVHEPYGMVVWSTGIGSRPVIKDFMQQIGQVCSSKTILSCHHLLLTIGSYLFMTLDSISLARQLI